MTVVKIVKETNAPVVTTSSQLGESILITQGASLWEADGVDHIKPKGGKTVDAPYLELSGKVDVVPAPLTTTSDGTVGTVAFSGEYLYLCTATNTWRRIQINGTW